MDQLFAFAVILAFSFAGEALHALLPLPIPAALYGIVLLLAALLTGLLKPERVRGAAGFLVAVMPVLFVAPAVNLLAYWSVLAPVLVPALVIVAVSTAVTFVVSGLTTQAAVRRREGRHD